MNVKDAIRKSPVTVAPSETLAEAARKMDQAAVGALMVVEDGRPVGVVTDRDVVVRGVAARLSADARVDSVMTTGVIAIDAGADLREAISLFGRHAIRRLPVVDGDQVCGLISLDDIVTDLTHDLADATRPLTAQVLFGHPEPRAALPLPR